MEEYSAQLLAALGENYLTIHVFDLVYNTIEVIKTTDYVRELHLEDPSAQNILHHVMQNLVCQESLSNAMEYTDLSSLPKRLKDHRKISFTFRDSVQGWCRADFIRLDEKNPVEKVVFAVVSIEEEVREANALNQVIQALSYEYATVLRVDLNTEEMQIISMNERVRTVYPDLFAQKTYPEAIRLYIDNLVNEKDRAYVESASSLSRLRDSLKWPDNLVLRYRNTLEKYGEEKIVRIDENTLVIGFADKDQTIRAEMQKEDELKNARMEAEKANAAKSAFLFSMSHDIRTPLNAMTGLAKLAQLRMHDTDHIEAYLKDINTAGEQLLNIINRVMEVSRIESKQVEILNENTDTEIIYHNLSSIFHSQLVIKNIDLVYDNQLRYRWLYLDRTHIEEILLNVIDNAIKYSRADGMVSLKFRSLPGEDEKHTVTQMVIEDNGIGISEEFQDRLFDQFEREQDTTNSGIQGSGLGLTIVKRLVDLMHGTIEIQSTKNVGTRVTIEIPHEIGYEPAPAAKKDAIDLSILKGKRVLLAEDVDINAIIAQEILKTHGLLVERAKNGRECVNMMMNSEQGYYDAVLMDIQMPEMDGYQATEAIRALNDQRKSTIPIIALTANVFVEDRIRALSAGMNSHVGKPIVVDQLFETICRALTFRDYYVNNNELNEFREKYYKLGCACGYFVYRADQEERLIGANAATAAIFGCEDSDEFMEYVGTSFRGMVHPEDLARAETEIAEQQENNTDHIDRIRYRIIRKDGAIRDVVDIGYKAFDGKDILYYVYIADVTDLRE